MEQAKSSTQRLDPSHHLQLWHLQPPAPLETRRDVDLVVESPSAGTSKPDFAPLECYCKNIVFCSPLIKEREYRIQDGAGAEEAVTALLGLFAKPSLRVEE